MSIFEPSPDQRTIGPEPVGPAAEPAPVPHDNPAVAADTALLADATPTAEPKVFDEAYVKELRAENAKWRTQLRELESEFEGIDPDERRTLAEFARLSRAAESGDQDALARLNEMLGEEPAPEATPQQPVYDEAYFRRIAAEEAERIATAKDQARQTQQSITEIVSRAKDLGYEQGSEDYILLMRAANSVDPNEHPDLLAEGDRLVKAYKQSIVEQYLAQKEGQADGSLRVPSGSGVPPAHSTTPKTWAEARDSLRQRLDAASG